MIKKRTYRAVEVESFEVGALLGSLSVGTEVVVGLDVAKRKFVAVLASGAGEPFEIIRFEHPVNTFRFLDVLTRIRDAGLRVVVVMEPTGTYGDSIRHQLALRSIPVRRVSTKHVSDCAELYDRVPSKHDAKDACVIAWLHSTGRSTAWEPTSSLQRTLRALVSQRDLYDTPLRRLRAQLEPLLARHFPEFESFFELSLSCTPLALLEAFQSPAKVASAGAVEIGAFIRRVSRHAKDDDEVMRFVEAASRSLGVPMVEEENRLIQRLAAEMLRLVKLIREIDARIAKAGAEDAVITAMRPVVGPTTAAVIVAHMGSPASYGSAAAFEKAAGLNLREHSSGTQQGRLRISKRGPGRVRKYLFLAALRLIQTNATVRAWYQHRRAFTEDARLKAAIALTRKLARALVHIARGAPFDAAKLFDTRRLEALTPDTSSTTGLEAAMN